MSSHCSKYPGCGCGPDVGTKCHMENYDQAEQDKINEQYKQIEFLKFTETHKRFGVFILCKETGPKGGYILPTIPLQDWITPERIRFTANENKVQDLNEAIGYRAMTKKERKDRGYKRKPYGK